MCVADIVAVCVYTPQYFLHVRCPAILPLLVCGGAARRRRQLRERLAQTNGLIEYDGSHVGISQKLDEGVDHAETGAHDRYQPDRLSHLIVGRETCTTLEWLDGINYQEQASSWGVRATFCIVRVAIGDAISTSFICRSFEHS